MPTMDEKLEWLKSVSEYAKFTIAGLLAAGNPSTEETVKKAWELARSMASFEVMILDEVVKPQNKDRLL